MSRKQILLFSLLCFASPLVAGCQRADELGPVASATAVSTIREAFAGGAAASSGSASAVAATGSGWATLKGRFVFDGTPPARKPYGVNRDQATCTIGGKAPLQETLVVDSATKGIANVAIYIRKASRVHESAQPNSERKVFDQKQCVFLTHVLPVSLGQTIELKNSDDVAHNAKIDGKNSFNQSIPGGKTLDFTPQKEEAVPAAIACSIHPWMLAYYLPRSNGYVAITAPDGSFEIPNVPAGEELEFQVWHESATGPAGALVLATPEAKQMKWSKKGRFKIKLAEGEEKELEITVPAAALGG